ncbi:MAG TPA: hypothetical protein PK280_06570 [Planctomycetota bacterium]|nr:hypothetical protein [Planctomycetota bacterium]
MAMAKNTSFAAQAERILSLQVKHRTSRLGGYGPDGEVIYEGHPNGCPSVLVTNLPGAKATFQSNGSIDFEVKLPEGLEVRVLSGSFDTTEKRETGVPSANLWLDLGTIAGARRIAALVNPRCGTNCEPEGIRIVKLGDPGRCMWYCASFRPAPGVAFTTAVRLSFVAAAGGPALLREVLIRNDGRRALAGKLWSFFNLHGTQRFVYNKEIWYDSGLPVTPNDIVVNATVPYSDIVQLKRVSSVPGPGLRPAEATCDYSAFVGDSGALSLLPEAVRRGELLPGAGRKLNRFSVGTIAAGTFDLRLGAGKAAGLAQSLLYVTDPKLAAAFRAKSSCSFSDYPRVAAAFTAAARELVRRTPDARRIAAAAAAASARPQPAAFAIEMPGQPVVSEYAKSVWIGVEELYENCRAHGAKMAEGIELGTRDRAQDMWPKMKADPGRVRADLVHAMGFMYVTAGAGRASRPMTLVEKLHGMFPRQYPSRWDDRSKEVKNDNRPYADSPLWFLNSVAMYVRETGDASVLAEKVTTVKLTDPEHPERSGIVGADRTQTVAAAMLEVLECFGRHVADSPYGLAQMMYGDWCDPLDMIGTSKVGDALTRGRGRGTQVRLSAHLFECLVETIDLLETPRVARAVAALKLAGRLPALKKLASELRKSIVRVAWEPAAKGAPAGFVACIHELRSDGSRPKYAKGETGYAVGSMRSREFDGVGRRDLATQAYCLKMLRTERDWLEPVAGGAGIAGELLAGVDAALFDDRLGLRLWHPPMANSARTLALVGRMGVLPAGCAENGEYHHGQVMMHRNRIGIAGQTGRAWEQFKRMISAMRDETLAGPFETPATSYASDSADPHYGKGMYFGLSGSTDWIIELFGQVAGVELNLHDDRRPALRVAPCLPEALGGRLSFRRIIHQARPGGGYRKIPLSLEVSTRGSGSRVLGTEVTLNGRRVPAAEVARLDGLSRVDLAVTVLRGR